MTEVDTNQTSTGSWQKQLREGNTWSEKCPIPLERLTRLQIQFVDFVAEIHEFPTAAQFFVDPVGWDGVGGSFMI